MSGSKYPRGLRVKFPPPFTIAIATVATIASIGMISTYVFSKKEVKENLIFSAAIITAAAGITSSIYVAQTLEFNAEAKNIDRTLMYISRWNDIQFAKARVPVANMMASMDSLPDEKHPEFVRDELKDPNLKGEVISVLNFLEEMACCIKQGFIDKDALTHFYKGIVIVYWKKFSAWIVERRTIKNNQRIFENLEELAKEWNPDFP